MATEITCKKCGRDVDIIHDGIHQPVCPGCGERICAYCGCTDSAGCPEGCYWAAPGCCSACKDEV